jgi:type IV pilus assembly protein PilB
MQMRVTRKKITMTNNKAEPIEENTSAEEKAPEEARNKDFVELLTENLSWQTIRDIMTYDVNRPLMEKTTGDLADIALQRGWITSEQYDDLRNSEEDVSKSLGLSMIERGLITEKQLKKAMAVMERTGQPLWRTLLQLKMTLPSDVVQFLKSDIELPFGKRPRPILCRYLVEEGHLSEKQLDAAWSEAKARKVEFGRYLESSGMVSDEMLERGTALELGLPFDDLADVDEVSTHLLRMIPSGVLLRFTALPYKIEDEKLFVAFSDERHMEEMTKLGLMLKMPIQPVLAPRARLEELLERLVSDDTFKNAFIQDTETEGNESPVANMLTVIMRGLLNAEGSDIHIEPSADSARVRYRVDGILHDFLTLKPDMARRVTARIKGLASMEIEQHFMPQDGHLNIRIDDADRNFRVATIPSIYGETIALRLVQSEMAFSSFAQLGMVKSQRQLMADLLNSPSGLVLSAGPVGSGKTTTLYSCLNCLDCFNQNIMTIEDPVEFELTGVTQVQVRNKRGLTFGAGVRALLRQDADTLMIGEIRDEETAQIAIRASLSGTLVLSTIHANSATAAIASLMQLGVTGFSAGNALTGVVFQRLVHRICKKCREPYEADEMERKELQIEGDDPVTLYRSPGCASCFRTGFHGRIGVYEIVKLDEEMRQVMFSRPTQGELHAAALKAGMIPLQAHVRDLVISGEISLKEMLRTI